MSFRKAEDYFLRIFCEEEKQKDFHIFLSSDKYGFAGGFLDNKEAYKLIKKDNMSGIKIDNGKYIFLQTRMSFIQSPKCKELFEYEDDDEISEEQFKNDFKDVQYVELFESDKESKTTKKISYLMNKSTQLLLEYYQIYENYDNIECNLNENYFSKSFLYKVKVNRPSDSNFDIMKCDKTLLLIPDYYHILFEMNNNGHEIKNILFRKSFIKKVYSEILLAERASLFFQEDFKDCFSVIQNTIKNNFGKNSEEGR